jgi:hypothetical protein
LVHGDQNIENQNRSFAVTDIGKNCPEIAQQAWGKDTKVLAWPKDMAALRATGLAGESGGVDDQAVFSKNPSPAFADNSNYLSLARSGGGDIATNYADRQKMLGSANGGTTDLTHVADYAGIRRSSTATLSLKSRFTTTT